MAQVIPCRKGQKCRPVDHTPVEPVAAIAAIVAVAIVAVAIVVWEVVQVDRPEEYVPAVMVRVRGQTKLLTSQITPVKIIPGIVQNVAVPARLIHIEDLCVGRAMARDI
jgi:hypothetical protein